MDKISITKVAYLIYVASCFWSRVKPRGHCIRYRDIYSRFPSHRHFCEARSEERFRIKKNMPFRKDVVVAVHGLFYCNNKFPFGRSEF